MNNLVIVIKFVLISLLANAGNIPKNMDTSFCDKITNGAALSTLEPLVKEYKPYSVQVYDTKDNFKAIFKQKGPSFDIKQLNTNAGSLFITFKPHTLDTLSCTVTFSNGKIDGKKSDYSD